MQVQAYEAFQQALGPARDRRIDSAEFFLTFIDSMQARGGGPRDAAERTLGERIAVFDSLMKQPQFRESVFVYVERVARGTVTVKVKDGDNDTGYRGGPPLFEDVCGIRQKRPGAADEIGSGVLISASCVLTAAHVVERTEPYEDTTLYFGKDIWNNPVTRTPCLILHHSGPTGTPDVAMVFFKKPLPSTPAFKAWADTAELNVLGPVTLSGFGAVSANPRSPLGTRRYAPVLVSSRSCETINGTAPPGNCVSGIELSTAETDKRDQCPGDSGGGVYIQAGTGADGRPVFRLAGIMRRGVVNERTCGYGGISTRIDAIAGWVRGNLNRPTDAPLHAMNKEQP